LELFFKQTPNLFTDGCVAKMNGMIEQLRSCAGGVTTPADRTDEQLLMEYRSLGDRSAFEELVRRYERELFGYLRNYLDDAEMAEDVFQQTFLQVHLKCEQFEPGRMVRPWLYTVATNQAIDCQRRNRRHRMVSLDRQAGAEAEDETGTLVTLLDSPEPDPAEQSEAAERSLEVRRALETLPEQTRQLVMLVYFQGLKYREAAEALDIPVGTVKSRLHSAIQKLNEALKP
jgi:RNA polymerase sigma-70 factor, ECF subfamily